MKKLFGNLLMFFSLILLGVGITACTEAPEGNENVVVTLTAEVTKAEGNTAEIAVSTTGISELAYVVVGASEEAPIPVVLFKDGTVMSVSDGTKTITLEDLEYEANYSIHIAGKIASKKGGFHNEVVSASFKTANYTEDVTVVRLNYDGADIHVRVPEEVKARGNKLKWMVMSVPYRKDWKPAMTGYFTDAEMIQHNDKNFPMFLIHRDTTLRIREENRIFVSPYDGELTEVYQYICPGEQMFVSIQEVLYVDSGVGYGMGWYGTPFLTDQFMADYEAAGGGGAGTPWANATRAGVPDEENYWPENSWHKTLRLTAKDPGKLDATVAVGLQGYDGSANLSPKGGKLTFVPEEGVYNYCVMILPHSLYQSVLLNQLEGKRDRLQWYTSSFHAAWSGLSTSLYASAGPASIDIAELFGGNVIPGGTYDVFVTAMAGKEGAEGMESDPTLQSFVQTKFEIPNYTLPAPTLKVTGLKSDNPFEVKFNVKCTSADTNPIEKASFACNYTRDFSLYINSYKYTYAELIQMNTLQGVYFTDADIQKMNSPEGCDVTFYSREDAASGLVVQGWNYEGRPSNPDAEDSEAYAEARSPQIPDADRVESPLFEELLGDWTATTTLNAVKTIYVKDEDGKYVYDENNQIVTEKQQIVKEVKSKVTIGDLKYPETLSDADYKIYTNAGISKAETDALFAEFKELAANFNRKVRGQNRLLCQGLDFDQLEESYSDILNHKSAWDLFISPDYSSSSVEDGFYDFGPKWHLQIDSKGNVFVPVNVNRILPLTNWQRAEVLFFGYNPDTNEALMAPQNDSNDASTWPNLPVEVSADKNTLTVKPFVYNYTDENGNTAQRTYYPNMIINTNSVYGMIPLSGKIKGDIVLTRGWSDDSTESSDSATPQTNSVVRPMSGTPIKSANGAQYVKKSIKPRTNFEAGAVRLKPANDVEYTAVKVKSIDVEKFSQRTLSPNFLTNRGE